MPPPSTWLLWCGALPLGAWAACCAACAPPGCPSWLVVLSRHSGGRSRAGAPPVPRLQVFPPAWIFALAPTLPLTDLNSLRFYSLGTYSTSKAYARLLDVSELEPVRLGLGLGAGSQPACPPCLPHAVHARHAKPGPGARAAAPDGPLLQHNAAIRALRLPAQGVGFPVQWREQIPFSLSPASLPGLLDGQASIPGLGHCRPASYQNHLALALFSAPGCHG